MQLIQSLVSRVIGKKRARQILRLWQKRTIDGFHKIYYNSGVWTRTNWLGVPIQKCLLDVWIYQEILQELTPDLIIETGTAAGGSAFYLASLLDLLGNGQIVTIDINSNENRPYHRRITYLQGSSIAPEIEEAVSQFAEGKRTIFVLLDSDHSKGHVLKEMEFYGKMVSSGSYMVVEDTNINGHPVLKRFGEGPYEAVQEFLKINKSFFVDYNMEKFFVSFNKHGYLKKK